MTDSRYAKSIELPTDQIFKNLKNAKRFAIDIGGSLAKLAYYSTVTRKKSTVVEPGKNNGQDNIYKVAEEDEIQDQLHFIKFETRYIETCLTFIQSYLKETEYVKGQVIKVTGGGAYKYKDLLKEKLGVEIDKEDEMECLIKGCNFLLKNIPDEAFLYQRHGNPEYQFMRAAEPDSIYPYLLVNIGSGVSILKVESDEKYERIGGTSLGGGTFWGLGSVLTKAKGFDELLELAEEGDHRNIDMLVRDIYGKGYTALNLPGDLIASSFGKAARCTSESDSEAPRTFSEADIAKSLLIGVSNDIGQIACLQARVHGLKKIYFGGYFIRGHPMTMHTITYGVNYWSKGDIQPMFLRHEGYLGAVGAFVKGVEEEGEHRNVNSPRLTSPSHADRSSFGNLTSWSENYAGSCSGFQSPLSSPTHSTDMPLTRNRLATFDSLELDRFAKPLVTCPLLLDPVGYLPDTEDLTHDEPAREYWLNCLEEAIDKFAERAVNSQPSTADAEKRAVHFKEKYVRRLHELKKNPCAYGSLTVRSLLDTREHCMEEFHFVDPYSMQKQTENESALKLLPARLDELRSKAWEARQLSLAKGMLAGNVFDWGAKEVAALMENEEDFGFTEAMGKLQVRPWLFDDFDDWLSRQRGPAYKSAVIFIDNSGIDIILGIFPFAVDLLERGTKVILCANSRPALNDVTYRELSVMTKKVAALSDVISSALAEGRLLVMESGQGSPCLDLRYIDYDLAGVIREHDVDLVVLEGMGRAVHTNLHANFACDALKVAVLKNRWLAERLGGEMFSVMFKYERAKKVSSS